MLAWFDGPLPDYPNAWHFNNCQGGTTHGEVPVIATLSQHSETNSCRSGGDRGFGKAGGVRTNINFHLGAGAIT